MGVAASWRRRRHGIFPAFRRGDRLRRHGGGGATDRTRPDQRPGQRRDASCRRRLRYRHPLREGTGTETADGGGIKADIFYGDFNSTTGKCLLSGFFAIITVLSRPSY